MITFDSLEVNALRDAAAEACPDPDAEPEGWSKSSANPMNLLAAFRALWIKPGFVLRAYQFQARGNGNGIIWAMPATAPFPPPEDCPSKSEQFLNPPRPPQSLDELTDAIEGDNTPWSYLSASIFTREAWEFGAMWHGSRWSTHLILGTDPWQRDPTAKDRRKRQAIASGDPAEWNWNAPRPDTWEPAYAEQDGVITITFHTFSGLEQEAIYRFSDTYQKGRYRFTTQQETVAEGPHGFIF